MRPLDWSRVRRGFEELCELTPAEAEARVAQELSADSAEGELLRRLLERARAEDAGALDRTALDLLESFDGAQGAPDVADLTGTVLGDVTLVRHLASGGMGDVWLGERAVGAARPRVAVKVLKRGLDTDALLARFRREQETLASLEHPGIVAFQGAGALPDGRPYFVMEVVDGAPITAWCDERELDVRARVELLRDAALAVAFAHQRLVLHRDLKPSNLLVTTAGAPKLLDFGVAGLVQAQGDATEATRARVPFTWRYASPEALAGARATVATDVYGLGLLLHELLAGRPAFDAAPRLAGGARPAPVSLLDAAPAARRRAIAGDLESIVRRALAADPAQRYATVEGFVRDLEAWLDGRAVEARRASWFERVGRFVARRPLAAGLVLAALLALIAGFAGTWIGKRRAQADSSRGWGAHAEAAQAAAFLEELLVRGVGPQSAGFSDAELDAAARRAEEQLGERPEARALVALALGRLELERGRPERARPHLERVLAIAARHGVPSEGSVERARGLLARSGGEGG